MRARDLIERRLDARQIVRPWQAIVHVGGGQELALIVEADTLQQRLSNRLSHAAMKLSESLHGSLLEFEMDLATLGRHEFEVRS